MRKIMLFLAVCVALTACKKEVLTKGTPFQKGQTVTISAGAGGGSNAKVEGTDDGANINFKWNDGDKIKVTVNGESSTFTLKSGAGSATAQFEGTMPASGTNFDIQYPVDDPNLSNQQYVTNGIQKGLVKFTATNCTIDGATTLTVASAILKFQFSGTQQVSKMVVETVDYPSPKSYTLNISGVTLSSTPTTFLMVGEPMTTKLKVTLYDNVSAVITSFTTSTPRELTAGGCLSMQDTPVELPNYLCFTAQEAGCTVAMTGAPNLLKSTDNGVSFQVWDGSQITLTNVGDKVYFKANNTNTSICKSFATTGKLKVSGNIMYLLNPNDPAAATMAKSCFQNLFYQCSIKDASELLLPATTLAQGCYNSMFNGCTELTSAPALPATGLADNCYFGMFNGCTNLTAAPALPATTLAQNCYQSMFNGCTELTSAPALPATTLQNHCYNSMFFGCSKLTSAPALNADTLALRCYFSMFNKCTSLKTAPELPATTLQNGCYNSMFCECTDLETAPELPATTLAQGCYQSMFNGCSKLQNVTMLATNVSATNCLNVWLQGAGPSSGPKYVHVASGMASNQTIIGNSSGWTLTTNP